MSNLMAIERYVRANAFSGPSKENGQRKFPVTVTACSTAMPLAFAAALPALTGKAEKSLTRPAPVTIIDVRLQSDRKILVDGKAIEIPLGVKRWIPVRAVKRLANGYAGSVLMVRKGDSWVRLRDHELVEIPGPGRQAEMKVLPNFRVE